MAVSRRQLAGGREETIVASNDEKGFRGLKVWQKGMDAVDAIYDVTRRYPREELYALTTQTRRAAQSVPMNIAEGYRRKKHLPDYMKFLRYADGSAAEVETAIEIAERQSYLAPELAAGIIAQYQEIGRMLGGLIRRIEQDGGANED